MKMTELQFRLIKENLKVLTSKPCFYKEKLKDIKQRPKYSIKKLEEEISQMEELLEEKRDLRYEPEYYQDSRKMQELDEEIDDIHNQIHALEVKWEEAMLFEEARKSS